MYTCTCTHTHTHLNYTRTVTTCDHIWASQPATLKWAKSACSNMYKLHLHFVHTHTGTPLCDLIRSNPRTVRTVGGSNDRVLPKMGCVRCIYSTAEGQWGWLCTCTSMFTGYSTYMYRMQGTCIYAPTRHIHAHVCSTYRGRRVYK